MSIFGLPACRPINTTPRVCWTLVFHRWAKPAGGISSTGASIPQHARTYSTNTPISAGASWKALGVADSIVDRLRENYPHIDRPTPAQQALLLTLLRQGKQDVFLRDYMGRGKTFVMALASLQLAQTQADPVLVLAPSQQLVEQISIHLHNLSDPAGSESRLVVTTPQAAIKDRTASMILNSRYSTVMMDEPETMLSPLPPRNLPAGALKSHPFVRHPPPLATLLNQIRPRPTSASNALAGPGPQTVWVGAEMNGLLKRVVRQRGWATMDALELDFGGAPSARGKRDVDLILGPAAAATGAAVSTSATPPSTAKHTSLLVDGKNDTMAATPLYRPGRPVIEHSMLDAIVGYEVQNPLRDGHAALILPPEGYPLDLLSARLAKTATNNKSDCRLRCSILDVGSHDGMANDSAEVPHMLIAPRSAVPGLDIPNLARIYLINGLDLAGLSPAQRARGGVKRRRAFYDVVTGRLGRLGSVTHPSAGQTQGEVISLVVRGSGEEMGLQQQ